MTQSPVSVNQLGPSFELAESPSGPLRTALSAKLFIESKLFIEFKLFEFKLFESKLFESKVKRRIVVPKMNSVHVELLEKDLWKKFSSVTNEMIVTKSGRRMFPVVKIRITGLNPTGFYQMKLEFVQIGTSRWKYMSGGWQTGGKAESSPCQSIYMHPDSPNLGSFWMKPEGITFSKVKLTNKPNALDQQVSSVSLPQGAPLL